MKIYQNPTISLDHNIIPNNQELEPKIITKNDYTGMDEVYFAFIDILGFTQAFRKNAGEEHEKDKDQELYDHYKDLFKYYFELIDAARFNMGANESWSASQTSDSLYFYTTETSILVTFVHILLHFYLYAMERNIFLRGGISHGGLYHKEKHQFYGTAVIHAYKLESEIAVNPALFLDRETFNSLSNDETMVQLLEEIDTSRRYKLKPFFALNDNLAPYFKDDPAFTDSIQLPDISIIKSNIEKHLDINEFDKRTYEKYLYLYNELNQFSNSVGEII